MAAPVSAIVVSYRHEPSALARLIAALRDQTAPPLDVLIVDNGDDSRLDELSGAGVRVLRPGGNLGYVRACNLAARKSGADWLLFINPDAVPDAALLERLLVAADERTAIAGAQVLLPGGERVNAGDNPLHVSGLSWAGRYGEPRESGPPRDVAVASGACLLVRRADFERLGGYQEGYFMYQDDVDLAWRARLAGRRVVFVPDAVVEHDYDFGKGAYKWFWLERNRLWTILSNYEARSLALLAPVLLATELAIVAFAVRSGWWREKLRGWRVLWAARAELRAWRAEVHARRAIPDAQLLQAMTGRLDTPLLAVRGIGAVGTAMEAYRRLVVALLRRWDPEPGSRCALLVGDPQYTGHVARQLAARGLRSVALPVRRGPVATLAAVRWALARHRPDVLVTLSGPPWVHVVGARAGRARPRWVAHVADPLPVRSGPRGWFIDPRARAIRAADLVTAAPDAADGLHRNVRVAVGRVVADTAELATAVAAPPPATHGASGRRILLLGSVNTPHVEHMALAMRDRGHHVVVAGEITPSYAPSVLPAEGVRVRPLEIPAMLWLRRLWRRERADVVHANWVPSYGFLAALLRMRPLVVMAWGSDVYGLRGLRERMARFAVRRADVAMSDSEALVRRLVELGADPDATFLLNWGVDLEAFAPPSDRAAVRRSLGLGPGPVVLSPRALRPLYNPLVIVDAFESATRGEADVQLVLKHIGTDPPDLGRSLPAAAHVVGHVPYEHLAAYYQAADICVSIPDSDSSPRSVWEAMACGCACIVSDLPWVHELIEDGRHALVVPPRADAVADALRRLLTDPGLAERIGAQARALVERHRDQRTEMDRLARLYENLAASSHLR